MFLPPNANIPWRPDEAAIRGKGGYVINEKQVEYIKQLIKSLQAMYAEIANVVNKNISDTLAEVDNSILGDGTAGRVFRCSHLQLVDGTDPATIRCRLTDTWNGDETDYVDNVPPDNSDNSGFSLNIGGQVLTISPTILSGNPQFASGKIVSQDTGDTGLLCDVSISYGASPLTYLAIEISTTTGGMSWPNMTDLVDLGVINIEIMYLTDA